MKSGIRIVETNALGYRDLDRSIPLFAVIDLGKFMTAAEVADLLPLWVQQVYRFAQTQQIPHVRIGGRLLFNTSAIDHRDTSEGQKVEISKIPSFSRFNSFGNENILAGNHSMAHN